MLGQPAGRDTGARYGRRRRRYLEYGLVVILATVLALAMLSRVEHLQGQVETLTLQSDVDVLRTAVVLAGIRDPGGPPPGSNPVSLLREPLQAYRGEADSVDVDALSPGIWRFDAGAEVLLYRTRHESTRLPDGLPGRVLIARIEEEGGSHQKMRLAIGSK